MIEEIQSILHVTNGICITIYNVIWYNHMYSYIIIIILVQVILFFGVIIQIIICQILENGDRYNFEFFNVH